MNKKLFILLMVAAYLTACNTFIKTDNRSDFPVEPDDPKIDNASWDSVSEDVLYASFVSIDDKYAKSVNPDITSIINSKRVEGWRGERLSAQVLLWTKVDIKDISIEMGTFQFEDKELPPESVYSRFVKYVLTDEFGVGCDDSIRDPSKHDVSLTADMLDTIHCISIPQKTVRPVWITIDIPMDAAAGVYTGDIKINTGQQRLHTFNLEIEVIDQLLPNPSEWRIHLDMWQHPSAVARIHQLDVWSNEHFIQMIPLMKMLANMGQKVITANLNKDPWNHQCFDAYENMISWTKNEDESWSYDYTIFDNWVQFMMNLGIKDQINCYSMLPWNNELHYFDAATDKMVTIKADPGTNHFKEVWAPFLTDFVAHLKQKNWVDITNIAMDERHPNDIDIAVNTIKEYAPELGISIQDNHKSYKRYPFIHDMCVGAEMPVEKEDILERREMGLKTTHYICCAHKFPNMFTFSDPAEIVYFSWFTAAADYDGWLHWSFNSWVEDPVNDSRFRTWPAGDTYIVYPGARSSIRYERTLEGIQDFEKIHILRNQFEASNQEEKINKLNALLGRFNTIERTSGWNADLNRAKTTINSISKDND